MSEEKREILNEEEVENAAGESTASPVGGEAGESAEASSVWEADGEAAPPVRETAGEEAVPDGGGMENARENPDGMESARENPGGAENARENPDGAEDAQEDPDGAAMKEQIGEMAAAFMRQEIGGALRNERRGERRERRKTIRRAEDRRMEDRRAGRPVIIYILLLFTAALLLMGLSSLMHQRTTLGAIGELQNDLDAMQEVQNFQEKIISLQEARQELEDQLKAMQSDMNGLLSQAQEERARTEAMRYLYRMQMQYGAGRYQACQVLIDEFESAGLVGSLPAESEDDGVPSPLDRYREIKAGNAVQVTEAMAPQTGVVVEEWTPSLPEEVPPEEAVPETESMGGEEAAPDGEAAGPDGGG